MWYGVELTLYFLFPRGNPWLGFTACLLYQAYLINLAFSVQQLLVEVLLTPRLLALGD